MTPPTFDTLREAFAAYPAATLAIVDTGDGWARAKFRGTCPMTGTPVLPGQHARTLRMVTRDGKDGRLLSHREGPHGDLRQRPPGDARDVEALRRGLGGGGQQGPPGGATVLGGGGVHPRRSARRGRSQAVPAEQADPREQVGDDVAPRARPSRRDGDRSGLVEGCRQRVIRAIFFLASSF